MIRVEEMNAALLRAIRKRQFFEALLLTKELAKIGPPKIVTEVTALIPMLEQMLLPEGVVRWMSIRNSRERGSREVAGAGLPIINGPDG